MATQLGSIKRVRRFPGFVVDGFNYQSPDVVAYFLTHFHADHTCGLHAGFKGPAPIYCTAVTAALLTNVMGVKPSLVCAVALNDTVQVQTADGANAFVTFLDANHCPGSATIHFRRRRGADDEDARTNTEKRKGVETRDVERGRPRQPWSGQPGRRGAYVGNCGARRVEAGQRGGLRQQQQPGHSAVTVGILLCPELNGTET